MRRLARVVGAPPRASSAGAPGLHLRARDVAARFESNAPRAATAPVSPAVTPTPPSPPAAGGGDWRPPPADAHRLAEAKEQLRRVALDPAKGPLTTDAGAQLVAVARVLRSVCDSYTLTLTPTGVHVPPTERRLPQALYWHAGYLGNKLLAFMDAVSAAGAGSPGGQQGQQPQLAPLSPSQAQELYGHVHALAGRPRVERVQRSPGDGAATGAPAAAVTAGWRFLRSKGAPLRDDGGSALERALLRLATLAPHPDAVGGASATSAAAGAPAAAAARRRAPPAVAPASTAASPAPSTPIADDRALQRQLRQVAAAAAEIEVDGTRGAIDVDAGPRLVVLLGSLREARSQLARRARAGGDHAAAQRLHSRALAAVCDKLVRYLSLFEPRQPRLQPGSRAAAAPTSAPASADASSELLLMPELDQPSVRPEALLLAQLSPSQQLALLTAAHDLAGRPALVPAVGSGSGGGLVAAGAHADDSAAFGAPSITALLALATAAAARTFVLPCPPPSAVDSVDGAYPPAGHPLRSVDGDALYPAALTTVRAAGAGVPLAQALVWEACRPERAAALLVRPAQQPAGSSGGHPPQPHAPLLLRAVELLKLADAAAVSAAASQITGEPPGLSPAVPTSLLSQVAAAAATAGSALAVSAQTALFSDGHQGPLLAGTRSLLRLHAALQQQQQLAAGAGSGTAASAPAAALAAATAALTASASALVSQLEAAAAYSPERRLRQAVASLAPGMAADIYRTVPATGAAAPQLMAALGQRVIRGSGGSSASPGGKAPPALATADLIALAAPLLERGGATAAGAVQLGAAVFATHQLAAALTAAPQPSAAAAPAAAAVLPAVRDQTTALRLLLRLARLQEQQLQAGASDGLASKQAQLLSASSTLAAAVAPGAAGLPVPALVELLQEAAACVELAAAHWQRGGAAAAAQLPASSVLPRVSALVAACLSTLTSTDVFTFGPLALHARTLALVASVRASLLRAASVVPAPAPATPHLDIAALEAAVAERSPADWRRDAAPATIAALLSAYTGGVEVPSAAAAGRGLELVTTAAVAALQRAGVPPYGGAPSASTGSVGTSSGPSLADAAAWFGGDSDGDVAALAAAAMAVARAIGPASSSGAGAQPPSPAAARAWVVASDAADAALLCFAARLATASKSRSADAAVSLLQRAASLVDAAAAAGYSAGAGQPAYALLAASAARLIVDVAGARRATAAAEGEDVERLLRACGTVAAAAVDASSAPAASPPGPVAVRQRYTPGGVAAAAAASSAAVDAHTLVAVGGRWLALQPPTPAGGSEGSSLPLLEARLLPAGDIVPPPTATSVALLPFLHALVAAGGLDVAAGGATGRDVARALIERINASAGSSIAATASGSAPPLASRAAAVQTALRRANARDAARDALAAFEADPLSVQQGQPQQWVASLAAAAAVTVGTSAGPAARQQRQQLK